jgi:tetratricopeptide (TPR) repeat protein
MLRALGWCLGLGAVATLTAGSGGTATPFALALASLLGGGAAGNFAHEVCKVLDRKVLGRLLDGRPGIAEKQVVVRALRTAQLDALGTVLRQFDAALGERRQGEAARFSRELARFLAERSQPAAILAFAKGDDMTDQEHALRQEVLDALPKAFDTGLAARRDSQAVAKGLHDIRRLVETAVLAELRLDLVAPKEALPPPFQELFEGTGGMPGWYDLYLRAAADRIADPEGKDGGAFARIWQTEQLALIRAVTDAHTAMLREIGEGVAAVREDVASVRIDTSALLAGMAGINETLARLAAENRVPEAPLRAVLERLGETGVPASEIPARLATKVDELLRLRADLARLRHDRPEFAALRARASALIDRGEFDAAGAVLRSGRDAARALREEADRQREEASRTEAQFLADEARVERLQLNYAAACDAFAEAVRLDPSECWVWIELGDLWQLRGSLSEAAKAFRGALRAATDAGADRDISVSHTRVGDVQRAQGSLEAALASYRAGLRIRDHLAQSDPGNTQWQRDLSVSHNKIGDVQRAQGSLEAALASYQAGLRIAEHLAQSDPGNTQWQRDLSVSHNKIGDVQQAQGSLEAALASYRAGLRIRKHLAQSDPGNAEWQRDLSVSHDRIGDVQQAQGSLGAALASYRVGLGIREHLAQSDPGNAEWQRDLSVSHERIGIVQAARGETGPAIAAFEAALHIYTALQQRNPDDLPSGLFSVGPLWLLGCLKGADGRPHLEAALAILEPLAAADRLDHDRRQWIDLIRAELPPDRAAS